MNSRSLFQWLGMWRKALPSGLELFLLAYLWMNLASDTVLDQPLQAILFVIVDLLVELGLLQPLYEHIGYHPLVYLGGISLFLVLVWSWSTARVTVQLWAKPADRVSVAVVLLGLFYCVDWLISTQTPYRYNPISWIGYPFVVFLATLLTASRNSHLRLAKGVAFAVWVQSVYAIIYHWLGIHQFSTPHFGMRTGGTLGTPNQLYPVVLMGVPLCLALMLGSGRRWERALWLGGAGLCGAALWYTYTRTAWIALALTLPLFTVGQQALVRARWAKTGIYALCAGLLVATALIRTGGEWLGNPNDRSFWGRFAIWQVALSVIAEHPLIGHGVSTYPEHQRRHMTQHLLQFDPANTEPKNLYLLLTSDVGLIGLGLFLFALWRYVQLYRRGLSCLHSDPQAQALVTGCTLGLFSILIAGLGDSPVMEFGRMPSTLMAMTLLGIATGLLNHAMPRPTLSMEQVRQNERRLLKRVAVVLPALLLLASLPLVSGYLQFLHYRNTIPAHRTQNPNRPRFTPLAQIPPAIRHAFIASEDGYFLQHHGVDWQALHRALRVNLRNLAFKQGGSTLTMQTARYLLVGREKTIPRKVAEILLALEMERHLSKARILELYLNSARFGLGAEEIGTACRVYFGKEPSELSLGEAGFLAGVLPEPPRTRDKLTVEKVERCRRRALSRLASFFPVEYSSQQIEQALRERIVFVWQKGGSP